MRAIRDDYPIQSSRAYTVRLSKFAGLKLLTTRPILGLFTRSFRARGEDYEDALSDSVRNVAKMGSANKIRHRCSAGMLALLRRRLRRFRSEDFAPRVEAAQSLRRALGDSVVCPGSAHCIHSHWAFPILVEDPTGVMDALRRAGFDGATLRRSEAVAAPEDRPKLDPVTAREALAKLVVLPCYPEMSRSELERQAAVIRRAVAHASSNSSDFPSSSPGSIGIGPVN